ncbi:MAG: hypothetical protein GX295_02870 [Syntrophomonadaceae bacterium]|nr:hypothetical protein [Syntrophomonadaceae bacterium]
MKILLVCTGNTCRSSMAEAIARDLLQEHGLDHRVTVVSAGIAAYPGQPATPEAVAALEKQGIDLSGHQARLLTPQMIKEADLILTMTWAHRQKVLQLVPMAAERVYALKQWAEPAEDPNELELRLAELMQQIEEKEQALATSWGIDLTALEQEREALRQRLQKVDDQLQGWREKLADATWMEWQEVMNLRRKLESGDLPDPIGRPLQVYQQVAWELREHLSRMVKDLVQKLNEKKED